MEAKEVSVKRLMRVHLTAHRKATLNRKLTTQKSTLQLQTTQQCKLFDKDPFKKGKCIQATSKQLNLPSINTANIDDYGYKSSKLLLEINEKAKSSEQITGVFTPRQIVNKLKRIKSQQSILVTEKHDFLRKLSKCRVLVKNPFQRRMSKNQGQMTLAESNILENESELSQSGCQQLSSILALL